MDRFYNKPFQMCLVTTDDIKLSYMSKLYNHYNLLYIFFALLYILCLILNMLEKSCLKNTLIDNLYVYLL